MSRDANRNPVPPITDDQRRAYLGKAMRVRTERKIIKCDIKRGLMTAHQAFELADKGVDAASGMRTQALIESLPDHGKAKARAVMQRLGISPSRRLRGVGVRQRAALLEYVEGAAR